MPPPESTNEVVGDDVCKGRYGCTGRNTTGRGGINVQNHSVKIQAAKRMNAPQNPETADKMQI